MAACGRQLFDLLVFQSWAKEQPIYPVLMWEMPEQFHASCHRLNHVERRRSTRFHAVELKLMVRRLLMDIVPPAAVGHGRTVAGHAQLKTSTSEHRLIYLLIKISSMFVLAVQWRTTLPDYRLQNSPTTIVGLCRWMSVTVHHLGMPQRSGRMSSHVRWTASALVLSQPTDAGIFPHSAKTGVSDVTTGDNSWKTLDEKWVFSSTAAGDYSIRDWCLHGRMDDWMLSNFFLNRYFSYSFSPILTTLGTHVLCANCTELWNRFAKFWF